STIKKQTGYGFFFQKELIRLAKPVTIHVVNEELSEVLITLFKDQPLDFSIKSKTILVSKKLIPANSYRPLIDISQIDLMSQRRVAISGTVTDDKGETLPGVSIRLKGSSIGSTTDPNGRYIIDIPNQEGVLVFTYIGYIT